MSATSRRRAWTTRGLGNWSNALANSGADSNASTDGSRDKGLSDGRFFIRYRLEKASVLFRYSDWQVELQPSPSVVLPSSHCSPAAALVWPSPQTTGVQSESQEAVSTPPSSQSSWPDQTKPSPQYAVVQVPPEPSGQSSVLSWSPSSQVSPAAELVYPSPQTTEVQSASHDAVSDPPSSQSSWPDQTKPSPQVAPTQVPPVPSGQLSVLSWSPSSQVSPAAWLVCPSPH